MREQQMRGIVNAAMNRHSFAKADLWYNLGQNFAQRIEGKNGSGGSFARMPSRSTRE